MSKRSSKRVWVSIGLALLFGTLSARTEPRLGTLQTYKDWVVGCDNTWRCEAVSLLPESAGPASDEGSIVLTRDPGAEGRVEIRFQTNAAVDFLVDDRKVVSGHAAGGEAVVSGPAAMMLAVAMANGTRLEVRKGDAVVGHPSLAGASAAMRYMDEQQGRAGTTTALVASGQLGADAVKTSPPVPVIDRVVPDAGLTAAPLSADERTTALKVSGCFRMAEADDKLELIPLSAPTTLVLVPCGRGAYNQNSGILIATGDVGTRRFVLPKFDYEPGWGTAGSSPSLINGGWYADSARLYSQSLGRGLGDCGSGQTFVWDGAMFRLVEARVMNECRGAAEFITVWRAKSRP